MTAAKRPRLGRGELLAGMSRPKRRGVFTADDEGLYVAEGTFKLGDPQLLIAWQDVVTLDVVGSEEEVSRTRAGYRKSFTVRHTRGAATTRSSARAFVVIGLRDDELVVRVNASPMAVRSALGPVLSRLRPHGE